MIRIKRKPRTSPQALADAHTTRLAAAGSLAGASGPITTELRESRAGSHATVHQPKTLVDGKEIDGYRVARPELYAMQYRKCCYCEWQPGMKGRDVEHFRPKAIYWWLAWSWENLLFCCDICNPTKGSYFPLKTNTTLQPTNPPPGSEAIWLLDPADPLADDPLEHIEFKSVMGRWRPFPRNGSRYGQEIIASVGLDRTDLLDLYQSHIEKFEDALKRIRTARDCGDPATLRTIWEDVCKRWLSATFEYVGLSRDVLQHEFKAEIQAHNLDLSVRYP